MYLRYNKKEKLASKRTAKAVMAEVGLFTKSDNFPQFIWFKFKVYLMIPRFW